MLKGCWQRVRNAKGRPDEQEEETDAGRISNVSGLAKVCTLQALTLCGLGLA